MKDITDVVAADGTDLTGDTYTYYVAYTITPNDLDTTIANKVSLSYNYKSEYSSGAFGGTAEADAKITATPFVGKDIVIDFGLPVTVSYEKWGKNVATKDTGSASYGKVSVASRHDNDTGKDY